MIPPAQARQQEPRRTEGYAARANDRVVGKCAAALALARGYSGHSMRATFITTALENGAQLEDVQQGWPSQSVND